MTFEGTSGTANKYYTVVYLHNAGRVSQAGQIQQNDVLGAVLSG